MLALPDSTSALHASQTSASFLVCGLNNALLGLDALAVSEIVPLPAIAPVVEKLPVIQGVLNLRGHIVPVLDLRTILGFEGRAPHPHDRLVVLEHEGQMLALPVDEVHDVQSIPADALAPGRAQSVVAGIGRVGDSIVQVLRLTTLFALARSATDGAPEEIAEYALAVSPAWSIPTEDQNVFRERATALARPLDTESEAANSQSVRHLAAVKLAGEYFGLDLRFVREFSPLQLLTPVPCSPSFVLGLINLRGEILTLVDARPSLGLAAFPRAVRANTSNEESQAQVVVIECNDLRLGLAVDEVIDVFVAKDAQFAAAPSAAREEGELVNSTVLYNRVRLSVLDLPKLVSQLLSHSDVASPESSW